MWIDVKIEFIPVIKAEFLASLLQSSSEIIIICCFASQTFLIIIINVENSHATKYLLETVMHLIFQDSLMNRSFKTIEAIYNRSIL